jgi:peptide-methionine (S)-S-oxide reductase
MGTATALRLPRPEQALPGRSNAMPVPASHFVNGNPIAPPFPEGLEQAVFGLGVIWGAERKFREAAGGRYTSCTHAAMPLTKVLTWPLLNPTPSESPIWFEVPRPT